LFSSECRGDGDRSAGDHPGVVEQVAGGDQLVQLGQRHDPGDGDKVAAAEPADLALDAALLMRAILAGDAEENESKP
jgi:hypothetical protein